MRFWLKDDLTSKSMVIDRAIWMSVVTLFVLFVFQPFGTNNDTSSFKFMRLFGYGLVTFCALFLSGRIEIWLARFRITEAKRLLIVPAIYIVTLAIFNHGYFVVAVLGAWFWHNQMMFIGYTFAIGILPIGFVIFFNCHARQVIENKNLNVFNSSTGSYEDNEEVKSQLVTLVGDNKGDRLHVDLSQILFIKSADNYCELAIVENGNVRNKMLRVTLTNILKQFPNESPVQRCHRSYAVNIALIEQSDGNAGGLQLKLRQSEHSVPVSRTYANAIKKTLLLTPNV